jgi:hypothetical protein
MPSLFFLCRSFPGRLCSRRPFVLSAALPIHYLSLLCRLAGERALGSQEAQEPLRLRQPRQAGVWTHRAMHRRRAPPR